MAIGSLTGNAGAGAAIGAIGGGVGGAIIGDQNRRKAEQAAAQQPPPPQPVVQQPYYTGSALNRFVGKWRISGQVDDGQGGQKAVSGSASGVIDKVFFVNIDVHFVDPRSNQQVDGTLVISQNGGRGVEMVNTFSSSPRAHSYRGDMDSTGNLINLRQFDPPGEHRKINIRFQNNGSWVADVWHNDKRIESYTFSPT